MKVSIDSFKSFDWRSIKRLIDPKAADDLNAFLEKLPQNTGQTMIVIAAVIWVCAGILGLYTTVRMQALSELHMELQEAEALQPVVPVVKDVPVNKQEVSGFVDKASKVYRGLTFRGQGATVTITAKSTSDFGQFREAIGHMQNGGSGWKVNVDRLCVGRECPKTPLSASLKINKVSVNKPG